MTATAASWRESERTSALDTFFEITARGSTFWREVLAGLTTFLVGAYIIFVNPSILSFSGDSAHQGLGPSFPAVLAATCLTAGVMTLLMGLFARYPFMMAPGMGLNSVVAYQLIVGSKLTWQEAMGVIFFEGLAITVLVMTGLRQSVMDAIPLRLKQSIAVGIGLFIGLIGLVDGGIVKMSGVEAAPVTLGNLATPTFAVTFFGLLVMSVWQVLGFKFNLLVGIVLTTIFAIVVNSLTGGAAYSALPGVAVVPSSVASLPDFSTLGAGFNIGVFPKIGVISALLTIFSLMLSDFFDTMGTVIGIGEQAGFVNERGEYPKNALQRLLLIDSIGALVGGAAGASSNTTYIESAAGVAEGGRTGLASVVTGLLFLLAMFFAPIAGVVPPQATAPALLMVAFYMFLGNIGGVIRGLSEMDMRDAVMEGLPALLTLAVMPFTYSITNGLGVGFITYTILSFARGRQVHWMLVLTSLAFAVYFLFHL